MGTLHQHLAPAFVAQGAPNIMSSTPMRMVGSLVGPNDRWPGQDQQLAALPRFATTPMRDVFAAFNGTERDQSRRLVIFMMQVLLRATSVDAEDDDISELAVPQSDDGYDENDDDSGESGGESSAEDSPDVSESDDDSSIE